MPARHGRLVAWNKVKQQVSVAFVLILLCPRRTMSHRLYFGSRKVPWNGQDICKGRLQDVNKDALGKQDWSKASE